MTASTEASATLVAFPVRHGIQALGYALVEEPRPGRFDVAAARALGVPEGPALGSPAARRDGGRAGRAGDGGAGARRPPRAGRKLVITGDTKPTRSVLETAVDADLLVHDGTFSAEEKERAEETNHSTAADAAEVARLAGARMLALTHLSNRYFGQRDPPRGPRPIFPETVVPQDFDIIDLPFPERGPPRLVKGGALPGEDGAAPFGKLRSRSK